MTSSRFWSFYSHGNSDAISKHSLQPLSLFCRCHLWKTTNEFTRGIASWCQCVFFLESWYSLVHCFEVFWVFWRHPLCTHNSCQEVKVNSQGANLKRDTSVLLLNGISLLPVFSLIIISWQKIKIT